MFALEPAGLSSIPSFKRVERNSVGRATGKRWIWIWICLWQPLSEQTSRWPASRPIAGGRAIIRATGENGKLENQESRIDQSLVLSCVRAELC